MTRRQPRQLPGGRKAFVYAVLVHVVLVALIVIGFRWQARPASAPPTIQAQAVTDAETLKDVERRKRAEQEREQQELRKQREQDEQRQQAEIRRRQEDEKRQAREAEQKRQEELQRQTQEAEKKLQDEQKRQAQAAERKRQDEEKRKAAEVARRKQEAEARRKSAEQGLQEQLAREEKERTEAKARAEQLARAQGELARYEGLIRQKVERNWVRPAGWTQGMECVVRVRLVPTGEVIQATVVRSSGNPAFDRSVQNAVYKASPLPLPEDKMLFEHFRELELRFRPEGQA